MYDDWAYGDVLKYDPDQPRAPAGTPEGGQWTDGFMAGSTAVDEKGEPLVVYHGTEAQFDAFDERMIGSKTDEGWAGRGFYFSSDPTVADAYGSRRVAAHLSLKNPYQFKGNFYEQVQAKGGPAGFSEWLRSEGYDGARLWSQYMVLDASQIRIVDVAKWNEADHPRHPAGAPASQGGEFAPKDGVAERRFKVPDGGPLAGDEEAMRSEAFDRNFETSRELTAQEQSTIDSYIVDGYSNINLYLNGYQFGEPMSGGFKSPFFDGEIANLDSAISSSRTINDVDVWRGFNMPRDLSRDDFTALLRDGDIINEKGFMSTSFSRDSAVNFAALRSTPLLLKIKVPAGTPALHIHMGMSKVYGEHEVILPRGSSLRLLTRPSYQKIRGEARGYVAEAELVKGN